MLVKPALYSAVKPDGTFHTLWVAEDRTLFLAWRGVVGDCFPVDPVSGRVRIDNNEIQVPFGSFEPNPKAIIVDDVPHDPYLICCRREANLEAPLWLKHARQVFMTTTPVTFVEQLVCRGVG